jgi:hypothetical protein
MSSRLSSISSRHPVGPLFETLEAYNAMLLWATWETIGRLTHLEIDIGQHSYSDKAWNEAVDLFAMDFPRLTKLLNKCSGRLDSLELQCEELTESITQISVLLERQHVYMLGTAFSAAQLQELKIRVQSIHTSPRHLLLRLRHSQKRAQTQLTVVSESPAYLPSTVNLIGQ